MISHGGSVSGSGRIPSSHRGRAQSAETVGGKMSVPGGVSALLTDSRSLKSLCRQTNGEQSACSTAKHLFILLNRITGRRGRAVGSLRPCRA
jgi:hypothetical protein